jgi:hypothetical protein
MQEPEPDMMVWLTDSSTLPPNLPTFLRDWLADYRFDPTYNEQ